MELKTANRVSQFYRFTVDMNNPNDVELVNNLRKNVSARNKHKWAQKQRVCLKGRLGKNNPKAENYRKYTGKYFNPYQTIRKDDAAHFDVYVYERR